MPNKPREKLRVPWEPLVVRGKKTAQQEKTSLFSKRNPINANAHKHKKVERELNKTYQKNNLNTFMAKSIKSEIQKKINNRDKHGRQ